MRSGAQARRTASTIVLVASLGATGALVAIGPDGVAVAAPANHGPTMSMSAQAMAQMRTASAAANKAAPKSASTIVIQNFSFSPGSIKVTPGQTIKVVNRDSVTHTVTSITGKFNTGDVHPGQVVTFTAPKKPGRYPYRCNIHQYMTGVVVVSS